MANSLPPGSKGTIPVEEAKAETAAWRDYIAGTDLTVRAFLFSMDIFKNLQSANPTADGIRVYLALKTPGDPSSATALLVPTINGEDITVLPQAEVKGDGGDDDPSNVFNTAAPCPPVCGGGDLNG